MQSISTSRSQSVDRFWGQSSLRFWRQRVDDPAVCDDPTIAVPDYSLQLVAERHQIRNLALHLCQMLVCDSIDCLARAVALIRQGEQCAYLIERKAQIARSTDEGQPPEMVGIVGAVVSHRAGRRRKKARFLIKPNGFCLRARAARAFRWSSS